tara:strand:- start:39010 stop:39261 length:252 start_codon:yes stop_codon:yes gene_type:complete
MNFTSTVVLHDGENSDWREHQGEACPLGCMLTQTEKGHHRGHQDEASSDANEARSEACKEPDGQERKKGDGIDRHDLKIEVER